MSPLTTCIGLLGKITNTEGTGMAGVERLDFDSPDETRTPNKTRVDLVRSGNATIGPMKIDIEQFKVVTDDKYQPLEALAKAKLGQIQMNVKTTFADGKASNEIDSGQGTKTKEDAVSAGAIIVNANLPLYPWSFLAMRADLKNQDPQQFPIYVLGQAEELGRDELRVQREALLQAEAAATGARARREQGRLHASGPSQNSSHRSNAYGLRCEPTETSRPKRSGHRRVP